MTVTTRSKEAYFPMMLSNGRDTMLVDYTGSNYTCQSGHTHAEQNQGNTCGWYKASHRSVEPRTAIQPVISAGINVSLFRSYAEPNDFTQTFIPEKALLITELTFAKKVKILVKSFMNADSIFCQRFEVTEKPDEIKTDLSFEVTGAASCISALRFKLENEFAGQPDGEREHRFTYKCGNTEGRGFMLSGTDYDHSATSGKITYGAFYDVGVGFTADRFVSCTDSSETLLGEDELERRLETARLGFDTLLSRHEKEWGDYFATSSVTLPNERINYLYNVSRYFLRSVQHPDTGMTMLGQIPSLWGGSLYDSWDSSLIHYALLAAGNNTEGRKYLQSYVDHAHIGREQLKELGIRGTTYAGWDDYLGNYTGWKSFNDYVTHYKPSFAAYMPLAAYLQYKFDPSSLTDEVKANVREIVDFLLDTLVVKKDGKWCIKAVSAGTEGDFDVEVDTFNQSTVSAGMRMAGEMLGDAECLRIARDLREGLNVNVREDGVLMPFKDADYLGGVQPIAYLTFLPETIDVKNIDEWVKVGRTPFGLDNDSTTEEYRHWPWNDGWALIAYAHERMPEKAMEFMLHQKEYSSSLGAIPEKIRLDGFVIGYWYSTSHAVFQWSICEALANIDKHNRINLCCGFDDSWKDVSCTDICIPGPFKISFTVKDGELKALKVKNCSESEKTVTVDYKAGRWTKEITVPAAGEYVM